MKIITLHQPWATFIALKLKQHETRHWLTNYRGEIAIHAAKRPIDDDGKYVVRQVYKLSSGQCPSNRGEYPLGAIVAISDLAGCLPMTRQMIDAITPLEKAVGLWEVGRYAWKMDNVLALPEPILYKGSQGIGNVTEATQEEIRVMLGRQKIEALL